MPTPPVVRRNPRLEGYDYAQSGVYFVTICTHLREHLFGAVVNAELILSEFGEIVRSDWEAIPTHYGQVELDCFVVMPNHVHGILIIHNDVDQSGVGKPTPYTAAPVGAGLVPPAKPISLSQIIGGYKSGVARRINALRKQPGTVVWQRTFYDHIVRSQSELDQIRLYIEANPARWLDDDLR